MGSQKRQYKPVQTGFELLKSATLFPLLKWSTAGFKKDVLWVYTNTVFPPKISRGAKLWATELEQFKCEFISDRNYLRERELQTSPALERLEVQLRGEGTWTGKMTDGVKHGTWNWADLEGRSWIMLDIATQREHGSKGVISRMFVLGFSWIVWLPVNRHSWVSALGWREQREQGIAVVQGLWAKPHP